VGQAHSLATILYHIFPAFQYEFYKNPTAQGTALCFFGGMPKKVNGGFEEEKRKITHLWLEADGFHMFSFAIPTTREKSNKLDIFRIV